MQRADFSGPGGRAEPARLALALAGIPFEDERVNFEDWQAKKAGTPTGALPVLTVDGEPITQSSAILRFVGKITGLYPEDALEALRVDEMDAMVEEVAMRTVIATAHLDGEERLAARVAFANDPNSSVHFWYRKINQKLAGSRSGFAVGDSMTICDLRIFCELTASTVRLCYVLICMHQL
eukprot:SAG22_NODE_350_length_11853_cov_3.693211_10_plen_180_part_00